MSAMRGRVRSRGTVLHGWVVAAAALLLLLLQAPLAFGQTVYFHNDVLGSPVVATDANGAVLWKQQYRPYGQPAGAVSGGVGESRLGFGGKPYEAGQQLSYFGARYYEPGSGRFIGIDPKEAEAGDLHSINRYAYANNNPYRYIDPDGRSPVDLLFLAYDLGALAHAMHRGGDLKGPLIDVGLSLVGVLSPVPATGQAIKAVRAAEHVAHAADAARSVKGVSKYEVGAYDALKSRSVAGDGLDIHHAVQKNPAGQVVSGYNPGNAPSIAIPRGEHSMIPTIKGEYTGSARDLLAKDIRDLRNSTNAPNSALRELIDLNKQTYPAAFGK